MAYGLRNLTDIPQGLRELHRVIKPDAKVAILDFHKPTHPLMSQFQQWYLNAVVVPTAEKNLDSVKSMLTFSPSVDRFPLGHEQIELGKSCRVYQRHPLPYCRGNDGRFGGNEIAA